MAVQQLPRKDVQLGDVTNRVRTGKQGFDLYLIWGKAFFSTCQGHWTSHQAMKTLLNRVAEGS